METGYRPMGGADVNLLERIDHRLSDTRARINAHDFEDCATSLLSPIYAGLVPITGGSDFGLDAEISSQQGITGLVITSSRSTEGAKRSLRDSLQSVRKNRVPVDRVVVVNLAEMNRSRREKLREIAEAFDCELVQVYDRAWFANQFRENPDWRLKVLHIDGGPFSLSRYPSGARSTDQQLQTIGRSDLVRRVNDSEGDVLLFGVPGVGKSHVASKLDGALFLERLPTPERLLDDLIHAKPDIVVVDDAGARLGDVHLLLQLRIAESLDYRIVVTCWPHETAQVTDHLPRVVTIEVEALTRKELGSILRERGITRLPVIAHILEQAVGRPAWALNLADLLIDQNDWESVWSGSALRDQILTFLRLSNVSEDAVDVLGTLALLGRVNEDHLRRLADLLQIRQAKLMQLIRSVAIAGLVDVEDSKHFNRETHQVEQTQFYRVQPNIVAANIASEVHFSAGLPPVNLTDVYAHFSELSAGIIQTQIYAQLLGAERPKTPTIAEFSAVLPEAGRAEELLQSFQRLGTREARAVVDILAARVRAALSAENLEAADEEAKRLAASVADAVEGGISDALGSFVGVLSDLERAGREVTPAIKQLVDDVRDASRGDQPKFADLMKLVKSLQALPEDKLADSVWIALVREILTPTFDGNYMSPEVRNQFVLQSFTWAADDLETLYDAVRPMLNVRVPSFTLAAQGQLVALLNLWVGIARGHSLPFGGRPSEAQSQAADRVAKDLASTLGPFIRTPDIRAKFNRTAKTHKVRLVEQDTLFTALTTEPDYTKDYKGALRRRDAALDRALMRFQQSPTTLMDWLIEHHDALAAVMPAATGPWQVFSRLARQPRSPVVSWLTAATEYGLAGFATPLIDACARLDQLSTELTNRLLADAKSRGGVVSAVLSHSTNALLIQKVVDQLSPFDVYKLESAFVLRHASPQTRHAIFTHADEGVRGTAAALWLSEWAYEENFVPEDPDWLDAIASYSLPEDIRNSHSHTQGMRQLAKFSPAIFMDVFVRHATTTMRTSFRDLDEWEEPVELLNQAQRTTLWERVRHLELSKELFWVVAAKDSDWIRLTVGKHGFDIAAPDLLGALQFQFGPRYPLEVLATMLQPLHPKPEELLRTLEVGSFTGEEHERYGERLKKLKMLAESKDAYIARVGRIGVEMYEPLLQESLAKARKADIHGIHFS